MLNLGFADFLAAIYYIDNPLTRTSQIIPKHVRKFLQFLYNHCLRLNECHDRREVLSYILTDSITKRKQIFNEIINQQKSV